MEYRIMHTFQIRSPTFTYRAEIKLAILITNYQINKIKRDQIINYDNFTPHTKPDSVIFRYFELDSAFKWNNLIGWDRRGQR
jgi:hypothetical protein